MIPPVPQKGQLRINWPPVLKAMWQLQARLGLLGQAGKDHGDVIAGVVVAVQAITTPLQWTLPVVAATAVSTVISVQGEKAWLLRNSMPFLWMTTESGERVSQAGLSGVEL